MVAPTAAGDPLLERVHDARRHGATVLALEGAAPASPGGSAGPGDLAGLAHGRLAVGTGEDEPFDLAQHLVSAAAGQPPGQRSALGRLAALAGRITAGPTISRW